MDYDDWAALELPPGADADAVRKAYKKLALRHHPDKGGDPAQFRRVAEAYVNLSEKPAEQSSSAHAPCADPYEVFSRFFGRKHDGVSFATQDELDNDEDAAIFLHPLINHVTPENLVGEGERGVIDADGDAAATDDALASLYVTRHRVV